ncbi:MAG TPA: helix-turn-helix domain-containing protein [Terriglobia bacterium]|nr:helix-turn-helix domain-containing protein [Terriglobia bacterium]
MKEQLDSLIDQLVDHGISYEDALSEFEKRFIKKVMENSKGNQSKAAQMLGIHRNTLSRKIGALDLDHRPKRRKGSSR